ncbi:DUF58 domain-containing protein [Phosphitispora fastidiosa]|uniref:DUF58 domain-containing protein n=1 Tax=Phosphitispora fastidiosa TaxID=2837202 RepID=UPI001E59CB91|nr:protein of unknown function (DUF58 family) [Phosphitispora fastidiosa]
MEGLFFEREFLNKLESMGFLLKKAMTGRYSGQHRSPRKGQSVEFADYRPYSSGDDWRQVDWNAYARLDRLFIKLFMEEQDLSVHLAVDTSGSMEWGGGAKLKMAREVAGALGYLALVNMEQVGAAALNNNMSGFLPLQRGKAGISRLWSYLGQLRPGGATDLNLALRKAGRFIRRPGITVLISDLLSPAGYQEGLKYLQHLGQQVVVLHIMSAAEKNPEILGNYRLVDCENQEFREVSITPMLLEAYRRQVNGFVEGIAGFCGSRQITYLSVTAEDNLEDILLHSLRSIGVLV